MNYGAYLAKRKLEDLLMYPLIRLGRLMERAPVKEYDIYFFFPFYHTGGAEKVHAQVAKAAGGKNCIIFFTKKSRDERFLQEFRESGCEIRDISAHTDNKLKYHENITWRGRISRMINSQKKRPVVFNGQCNFGYKLSPWLDKDIKQVELIHSFNTFSWIRIPFLPFISLTVMISRRRIEEHLAQYKKLGVPDEYGRRIRFIQNAIELPKEPCRKDFGQTRVLFVGRGTPEKRPELFVAIARQMPGLQFSMAGVMPESVTVDAPPNLRLIGNIDNPAELRRIYCDHQVLIIPSETEGFPIVLMEAMAAGCAVMATPVGDIPYHVNDQNGFLFSSIDPSTVISEACEWLKQRTTEDLQRISGHAARYAEMNFGLDRFNNEYKAILQP